MDNLFLLASTSQLLAGECEPKKTKFEDWKIVQRREIKLFFDECYRKAFNDEQFLECLTSTQEFFMFITLHLKKEDYILSKVERMQKITNMMVKMCEEGNNPPRMPLKRREFNLIFIQINNVCSLIKDPTKRQITRISLHKAFCKIFGQLTKEDYDLSVEERQEKISKMHRQIQEKDKNYFNIMEELREVILENSDENKDDLNTDKGFAADFEENLKKFITDFEAKIDVKDEETLALEADLEACLVKRNEALKKLNRLCNELDNVNLDE